MLCMYVWQHHVPEISRAAHLCDQYIAVQVAIDLRVALDPNQTVLLAVVQPVPCPPRPNPALQLVCLDPNELINPLVAPQL